MDITNIKAVVEAAVASKHVPQSEAASLITTAMTKPDGWLKDEIKSRVVSATKEAREAAWEAKQKKARMTETVTVTPTKATTSPVAASLPPATSTTAEQDKAEWQAILENDRLEKLRRNSGLMEARSSAVGQRGTALERALASAPNGPGPSGKNASPAIVPRDHIAPHADPVDDGAYLAKLQQDEAYRKAGVSREIAASLGLDEVPPPDLTVSDDLRLALAKIGSSPDAYQTAARNGFTAQAPKKY